MKIAIAQINSTVGDIAGNAALILSHYHKAVADGAELIVFPELVLTGYPPEDLILMPAVRQRAMAALKELAAQTSQSAAMIVGSVWEEMGAIFNTAVYMDDGKILHIQPKSMLPNYGIFDEKRLFIAGDGPKICEWRGMKIGLLICEDMWFPKLSAEYKKQGAELLIVINASPFEAGKLIQRQQFAAQAVAQAGVPLIYANMVGAQDDIVFDGGSFVMAADGEIVHQMVEFEESVAIVSSSQQPVLSTKQSLWRAMMLGLHDYIEKNGFPGVVLGLSGGIDSAISAAVAVDALGASKVKGVLLPSPYTSPESIEDALQSAKLLGIETMNVPITPGMGMFNELLTPLFEQPNWMEDVTLGGNVQARLRGMILMAISNRFGWMLLSTGNKSELSVGYSTLYGDSCGGYNVLKDLYKTQVYALAQWRNERSEAIPERSITKPPSAELAPGQKDEDQLPPYETLDRILALHIEGQRSAEEIIAQGFAPDIVHKIVKMVRLSEYKRRQSCPGVKLSSMLYGKDRRYPLTNKF